MLINARLPLPQGLRFSLRSILLVMMLTLLLLPLAALYFFRVYENELVRQTELELIAQSATLAASYRQMVSLMQPDQAYGYIMRYSSLAPPSQATRPSSYQRGQLPPDDYYTPITPRLDLVDPILPTRPDARRIASQGDDLALKVGQLMRPIMQNTQQFTLAGIRILDMDGVVIAGRSEMGLSLAHVPEVQRALRGHYASVIRQRVLDEAPPPLYSISRGTRIRVFSAFPIIEGKRLQGVIYLSRTPKNILKYLYMVQEKLYFATVLLLGIAVLLVLFISSSISRPIRELINQTHLITDGEQRSVEPLKQPVTHEVAQLSASFATMSQTLAERSDYIRRFAAHVSHEFKTPLTAIQGALELLQEHGDDMPAAQCQHFIANLIDDTQRLNDLVQRLLELARADALEPSRQHSVLPELIQPMIKRYAERGLAVHWQTKPNDLPPQTVAIAPDALESVLNNLLDNSLHHGASTVTLTAKTNHNALYLSIRDNGEGISAANRERIFTPFFTTRRNRGGTGLGLEISASLLKAYGGRIKLGTPEMGAEFIVQLTLAQPKQLQQNK